MSGESSSSAGVRLRVAEPADAGPLAEIFLSARRASLSYLRVVHTDEDVGAWYAATLVPAGHVVVAERTGRPVGFADAAPGWLNHLYVDPAAQGQGIGSLLFAEATRVRPEGFDLWVFQRNQGALRFYARHGCTEVLRTEGADNEEQEPDVLLRWSPPLGRRAGAPVG